MQESNETKKYKKLSIVFSIVDILLTVGPSLYFLIAAYAVATVTQRVQLSIMFVAALVVLFVSIINRLHLRSFTWIIIISITLVLKQVEILVFTVAIASILDEIIVAPLVRFYKGKLSINKEIDKRL